MEIPVRAVSDMMEEVSMHRTFARVAGLVMGACIAFGVAERPARAADLPMAEAETKQVAHVKVEIRQESGEVAKNTAQLEWNAESDVSFKGAEHQHDVQLKLVRPSAKSSKLSVTLSYNRDGEAIIAPYTIDTKVKKREVIRIEGGLAIALTVTPKKVKVAPPKEKKPGFNPGEGDDPLSGL